MSVAERIDNDVIDRRLPLDEASAIVRLANCVYVRVHIDEQALTTNLVRVTKREALYTLSSALKPGQLASLRSWFREDEQLIVVIGSFRTVK